MPEQHSSSSSSSSSDDGKWKESPRRRRSSSRESEKRRDSKRNYSSSDEDRKSKRRKELTVLSRNAKYGHRGFVGASFSRYKKGSRSRSVSKERYRSRDYRQRGDVSRYSRDDSYRRRTSDRRDRRRERHRSRDRNLRDRSRDRRRSKDRKERSRDRSRDRRRSKDRRERSRDRSEESRDRSEDKKEKDRDRSKDRKERNRDRSKDRRERSRSRSQSRSRNCSGDRSKSMERGSRKRRDYSRERNKDKREKGRERSHSGDRNKEREKKSRERSHDRSQSKEKSKERGHDRSQSKERCKEKPNLEGDQKISSYGDQSKVEKEGKVSCSSDDKRGESVSNIHDETPYADEEKSNLKEGNKADAKNSSEEDKEEYQDDKCEVLLKEENHLKLKGDNLNEDKEMFRQEKKIEKSDCKPSEIKLDVKEGSEKKDYEVKGKGTHIHSSKAEDKNLPEDDKRTYHEYDEKSSNSKEFGTNEEIQERDCDDSSEMGHSDSLDASESTAHTSMKSKDKLRKMPSPNYSSKHHVRASSTESSLSHSSHPTEKCEAIPDDNKVERESSNLDELEKLKEKITKELADDGRTRKHKSKKKKKSEKNEDSQREENINESSTTTMDSSSKKRKKMESSDSPRKDEKDADSSLNSKASSSRHHKRRRSKSNSRLSISPEKGKDERKSKGKHRKIENERDTYEERKRETDYDKKRRKEYEENDKEISKHKSSLQQDDKSKPDEKMFEEEKFASSLQIKKPVVDPLSKRTGGAYIPPGRLKLMQDQIKDKASESFQRLSWEALKKSINGIVNKVNVSNIGIIIRELFQENIVRGRGLLCRSLMQAQSFSQTFTHVYSALVCAINTKFPQIGELLLNRLIIQLRRGIKRNDKNICMASCKFLAHLVNQQVAHEVIALELLTLLLEKAKDLSDDSENGVKAREASIELSIVFLKECGMKLGELTPKGLTIITESLRNILHEGKLDSRYRYMVESLLAIQKDKFKGFESVNEDLDLVDDEDKITHIVELDGQLDGQDILNIFKVETDYLDNEAKYKELKSGILGASDDDGSESDSDSESGSDDDESGSSSDEEGNKRTTNDAGDVIVDRTETNLVAFRRTVYLTIQSSLDVDECAHKLLKGEIKPGWEEELCNMVIDCCAQQRTYMKFYGLLAERFCRLNKTYREFFETLFLSAYSTCHRLEIEKLRNVSKLFSHLLHTDAISWEVMANVQLNEDQTTSSSRVFLKILFEELANFMGLNKLNERLREPTLSHAFEGLLPRDNPNKTRFAINFFTMIGLGGLTDGLREFLRTQPKPTAVVAPVQKGTSLDSSSTDSEDSSDGSSSSSNSSDDGDSDSSDSSSESSSSSSDDDSGSDDSDDSSGSDKGSKAKKRKLSSKNKKGKSKSTSSSSKKRPRPKDEVRPSVRSYMSSDRPDKKTSSSSSSSRKRSSRL